MNRITKITKRDIIDLFRNGFGTDDFFESNTIKYFYWGRFEEIDFLKRLYNLSLLPSTDSRYNDAEGDIRQHTINNDEFLVLTMIGNDFRIRHHETNKIDINGNKHYEYLFNRCYSLIKAAAQHLQNGGGI